MATRGGAEEAGRGVPAPSAIYGAAFDCPCGRQHAIAPEAVLYLPDAWDRCPDLALRAMSEQARQARGPLPVRVGVICDQRTREAAGEAVCLALHRAGLQVSEIVLPDPPGEGTPVCDDLTLEDLQATLGEVDVVLPVGAGVISDLGKWLAFERDLPCVTFATAASMNGYASANVAPRIRGVKSLVRARPPRFVVADPDVLRRAPWRLTASGLGDVVAKSVSSLDWWVNHRLFGDYHCQASIDLVADLEPLYLGDPEGLRGGDARAMEALFQGLLLTGVAMTMAETSAPASGAEHLISHSLDMTASAVGVPHDLHGRQVGVGTRIALELYRRLLSLDAPRWQERFEGVDAGFWGPLTAEVAARSQEKAARRAHAVAFLSQPGAWDALRAELRIGLGDPQRVGVCLLRAGAAARPGDIGCAPARLSRVVAHAAQMRERFTVLDLAELCGVLPDAADELVAGL